MKSLQEAAAEIVAVIKPDEFFSVTEVIHRIKGGPVEGTHEFHVTVTPNVSFAGWFTLLSRFNNSLDVATAEVITAYRENT